jgi:hypothetical protein
MVGMLLEVVGRKPLHVALLDGTKKRKALWWFAQNSEGHTTHDTRHVGGCA